MSEELDLVGRVAMSTAGRDKGRSFIIASIADGNHVFLADGMLRKLAKPKRKKLKHIVLQPAVVENIRTKLLEGKPVFDAEIRKCLITLGYYAEQQG